jgi:signal peptidase I
MEPTLKDGDVVLVRKSDVWNPRASSSLPLPEDDPKSAERQKLKQLEQMHCKSNGSNSWLLQKPPSILSGSAVVYKSPQEYPAVWTIKRVIGVGGQVVGPVYFILI